MGNKTYTPANLRTALKATQSKGGAKWWKLVSVKTITIDGKDDNGGAIRYDRTILQCNRCKDGTHGTGDGKFNAHQWANTHFIDHRDMPSCKLADKHGMLPTTLLPPATVQN